MGVDGILGPFFSSFLSFFFLSCGLFCGFLAGLVGIPGCFFFVEDVVKIVMVLVMGMNGFFEMLRVLVLCDLCVVIIWGHLWRSEGITPLKIR